MFLLQENNFFEDSYSVYERGVKLFKFPHSREIWQAYLDDFVSRFGAEKLERARDLFEQCTSAVPPNEAKIFFLKYAQLEEEHGLARRAMDIYERACAKVPLNDVLDVYEIYVTRAMEFFGIGKVRSIYKSAIERELPHTETKALCTRFARLERKLGELDRARGLYIHGSQLANPQQDEDFWEEWNAFEVRHGNEDSFREMLRIKRSVTASFSQVHFNMMSVELPSEVDKLKCSVLGANNNKKRGGSVHLEDTMVSLEEAALKSGVAGFVKSHTEGGEVTSCDANHNPDEIELDDDVQDDNQVVDVEQESIPEKLFSGNVKEDADVNEGPGALHRFKKRRVGCD